MRSDDYADLVEILQHARDKTAQAAISFEQDLGWYWNCNADMGYRQSVVRAALRDHPRLEVVEDRSAEFGRIKVVAPEGGPPYLLKPLGSLLGPSPDDPDSGVQQYFFGIPDVEPLLAYKISREGAVLYEGECRQVQRNGGRTDFEIVGELRAVWTGDNTAPSFDQEEDTDWLSYLDDREGETGTIS